MLSGPLVGLSCLKCQLDKSKGPIVLAYSNPTSSLHSCFLLKSEPKHAPARASSWFSPFLTTIQRSPDIPTMLLLPTISFLYERWQLYKTYCSIHGFLTWSIQLQWYSRLDVTAINLNCILWFLWWTGLFKGNCKYLVF